MAIKWQTAAYGGIGGVLAPALTLAQVLMGEGTRQLPPSIPFWLLGAAILFMLGAAVASVSGEEIPLKAIAIGISLPAMVTVYNQPSNQAATAPPRVAIGSFVTLAFGQPTGGRQLIVSAPTDLHGFQIWFYGPNGIMSPSIQAPTAANATIAVPTEATGVAVQGPKGWSSVEALPASPANGPMTLKIGERSDFAISFRQAFGAGSASYDLDLR
jgi:hypothetical protein